MYGSANIFMGIDSLFFCEDTTDFTPSIILNLKKVLEQGLKKFLKNRQNFFFIFSSTKLYKVKNLTEKWKNFFLQI